jgi:hypothetical protein
VIRAEPPRDGFGASLRVGMERRGVRARFYSLKAVPRKERRDLRNGFDRWLRWKKIRLASWEGRRCPDRWTRDVSDDREENAAACSQAGPAALAGLSPRRDAGEGERATHGNRPAAGSAQAAKRGNGTRVREQAGESPMFGVSN